MNKFKKITEEVFYNDYDWEDYLVDHVKTFYVGNSNDVCYSMGERLINCESPIEQILAIQMEWIKLLDMHNFNPFIDVLSIENQKEIHCNNRKYRVDFYIPVQYKNQELIKFVIECDGYEFHQKTKIQIEKDNNRQRDLQKAGYEIIRFSGTEIWHKPYQCACEIRNIILSKCKYIKEVK